MAKTKHLIAVYGTLKKGFHNHHYMSGTRYVGKARVGSGLALFVDGLPYLVEHKEGLGCLVELYEVDDRAMANLDALEGHPRFYRRVQVSVSKGLLAWIYILNEGSQFYKELDIKYAVESYDGNDSVPLDDGEKKSS